MIIRLENIAQSIEQIAARVAAVFIQRYSFQATPPT
jgi:hypothetical protein